MRAVIVGTGRVGCGFVGPALRAAGFDLVFVGRNPPMVEHLGRLGRYRVRLIHAGQFEEQVVDGVRSVHCSDADAVTREVVAADLVATAVGADSLPAAASLIAPGLLRRREPVNVLAFENLVDAGPRLRALVTEQLVVGDGTWRHGFAGALVTRVIAQRLGDPRGDEPVSFVGDPPCAFRVEASGLGPALPAIPGMTLVDDYAAWMKSKLYIFGAGHATAAYLGYLKGYRFVHSAIRDPEIREVTLGAMTEGQHGVAARFGPDLAGGPDRLPAVLARFENAALCDPVCRVGRDPCRKLACDDRLVGAARLAEEAGTSARNLALAIAAALYFQSVGDPSAVALRTRLWTCGVSETLRSVCGLDPRGPLIERVERAWNLLTPGRQPENFLLRLEPRAWAAERRRPRVATGRFRREPRPRAAIWAAK
jgi:mannitol-1-phosphate 5-dehydrogenase